MLFFRLRNVSFAVCLSMYYLCNSDKGRSGQTVPLRPLSDAVMRFVEKRYSKKLPALGRKRPSLAVHTSPQGVKAKGSQS